MRIVVVSVILLFTASAVTMGLLWWLWPSDPRLTMGNAPLEVLEYSNGTLVHDYSLDPDAAAARALMALIGSKRGGWRSSIVTFAPNILVRSTTFSVNLQPGRVIVNVEGERRRWKQAIAKLTDSEYVSITTLIKSAGPHKDDSDAKKTEGHASG